MTPTNRYWTSVYRWARGFAHLDEVPLKPGWKNGPRAIEKTHGDNQHGRDYRLAIALIRSRFGLDEESSK